MARRSILTAQERQSLVALPDNQTRLTIHHLKEPIVKMGQIVKISH